MNEHRPNKIWHLNYETHDFRDIPFHFTTLAYCYETGELNGTPHTHIVLEVVKPITKRKLIRNLAN